MATTRHVKGKPGKRKRNVLTARPQHQKAVRQSYPKEALEAALAEARQPNQERLTGIARNHGVPLTTLHRHLRGKTTCTQIGRQPYLSKEIESQIADRVLMWHDRGFSLQKSQLAAFVFCIAKKLQPNSRMVRSWERKGVSAKWTRGFLKRHPFISVRVADNLDHKRREPGPDCFKQFYDLLAQVNQDYGPFPAECIFNADEINFQPNGRQQSVLCRRGSKHAHTFGNLNRDSVTILPCISAAGKSMSPLIITRGAHLAAPRMMKALAEKFKGTTWEKAAMICQESGYMTRDIFELGMQTIFLPETEDLRADGKGVLHFLDKAHLDLRVLDLAADNGVHNIAFPAHTTHILQPLDVGIMQPIKTYYTKVSKP